MPVSNAIHQAAGSMLRKNGELHFLYTPVLDLHEARASNEPRARVESPNELEEAREELRAGARETKRGRRRHRAEKERGWVVGEEQNANRGGGTASAGARVGERMWARRATGPRLSPTGEHMHDAELPVDGQGGRSGWHRTKGGFNRSRAHPVRLGFGPAMENWRRRAPVNAA
ncbi:hypothetical protein B0H17DRAFT_1136128 [Mycena rosella]|uniref:Uncharacterized protein n=1 Tax=Mycena rosella TaxID=1033263 RepID=A0AAD7DC17_MYCRO|nr:hypothetical protein B0H17DRAFT_1136128 [Mycena rosella]